MTIQEEIKKLPTDEARELLFYAIEQLVCIYECEKCGNSDFCNLNFQEDTDIQCQRAILKQLKKHIIYE